MIDTEFAKQTSMDLVAQAVVDRVKRIHSDTFASGGERAKFCLRHEDMTLLVRNFGYPLGEMSQPSPSPAPGTNALQRAREWVWGPCSPAWRRPGFLEEAWLRVAFTLARLPASLCCMFHSFC